MAYTDRVKAILLECSQARVAEALAQDLKNFETGRIHDELQWTDVSLHACRILNASEKVIFLTADQLRLGSSLITHAQRDGYRVIVVPTSIAFKLPPAQGYSRAAYSRPGRIPGRVGSQLSIYLCRA